MWNASIRGTRAGRSQPVTAVPPDPDPTNTPGLGPGGGIEPGETPPESAHTSATANSDPPARRTFTAMPVASLIAIGLFVALFLAVGVLVILKIVGTFG
jgi:hypothetical protein